MRVCLISDEANNHQLIAAVESVAGVLITVGRGIGGVDRVLAESPEVVIVDLATVDPDGLEIARCIRAFARSRPRLIALTPRTSPTVVGELREAGFDAHLVKPLDRRRARALIGFFFEPEWSA